VSNKSLDYRSEGDTRLTIDGSRHYKTPYGALPSVTTILSATSGNKAALERWAKKNPGGREAAAARGTKVHSLMEEYLLGIDKDPQIETLSGQKILLSLMIMVGQWEEMEYLVSGIQVLIKIKHKDGLEHLT
jgi:hypothetical protein